MNEVILIGRLTHDPDLRFLQTGTAITRFSIAVDRSYKKNGNVVTDFIPIEVWGKVSEFCANYLNKGRLVAINGSLHLDRVDGENGYTVYSKVVAKTVKALDYRKNDTDNAAVGQVGDAVGFKALDDEEIPF